MDRSRTRNQVRLTIVENEPLARLTEQRLRQENIPCVLRSLGVGPGGWGVGTNLPHAVYVKSTDEMHARQVLDLPPAEIEEREDPPTPPTRRRSFVLVLLLIITAAAILFGTLELMVQQVIH